MRTLGRASGNAPMNAEDVLRELKAMTSWPKHTVKAATKTHPPTPVRLDAKVFEWANRLDVAAPGSAAWNRIFAEVRFSGRALDFATLRRVMRGPR